MAVLTAKQEAFSQAIVDGLNQSDAYRHTYDASGMKPATIWDAASKLVASPQVAHRIEELRDQIVATIAWSFERGMQEVETNIRLARLEGQQSAAGASTRDALKLSGLLTENPQEARVQITKVTVVLNPGDSGQTQLLETRVIEGAGVVQTTEEEEELGDEVTDGA